MGWGTVAGTELLHDCRELLQGGGGGTLNGCEQPQHEMKKKKKETQVIHFTKEDFSVVVTPISFSPHWFTSVLNENNI